MSTTKLPRLLRARDVAEALGLQLSRVYELTAAGAIPHRRIGRSIYYPEHILRKWLDGADVQDTEAQEVGG